jgi:phosphoglycerate kinase
MKLIKSAQISNGIRVLVRTDMDVPLENGKILEEFRLERGLDTLKYIIEQGGFPVVCGHIGKPDGMFVEELSTRHLLSYYNSHLGEGNFELLENLRFSVGEEKNDESFAKELSEKADIYVNDSFATCHRAHASIVGITKFLKSYAGIELENEIDALTKVRLTPENPVISIVGGAKLESKKPVINELLKISDFVLVGGKIGMEWKEAIPENLKLPQDYAEEQKDIGEKTQEEYVSIISTAKTIVWAGPMGLYEDDRYIKGTKKIAEAVVEVTGKGAFSVVGGGDTVAAIQKLGMTTGVSFVSTGGSAMLDYLAKGTLLGVEALDND